MPIYRIGECVSLSNSRGYMENKQALNAKILSASINDIPIYTGDSNRNSVLSGTRKNSVLDNLVKEGKLTQEQAALVRSADKNSMFSTLLAAMQDPTGESSTESAVDPGSILLNAL